jgi:hypothetical protein
MKKTVMVALGVLALVTVGTAHALDVTDDIVEPAQEWQGSRYCFGSASPDCFDCSGFVNYIYKPHVPELPRSSRSMARFGSSVGRTEIRPGDLLFFATGPDASVVSHVAIYIGQNSIIHAVSDGPERGVTVTTLDARYWQSRYHSARRVLSFESAQQGSTASGGGSPATPGSAGASGSPGAQTEETATATVEFAKGTYEGELENGEPQGDGVMELNNGDRYEGEFRNGVFHGTGTYTWADGRSYRGRFENGAIAADGARATYLEKKDSPWNDFDGVVRGDFAAWWEDEQDAFEQWKQEQQDY